jgi:WD40 repeat protein
MIVIWENLACRPENASINDQEALLGAFPIKNIFDAHQGNGCVSCQFTTDSKYLLTLGAGTFDSSEPEQTLCVWDWTTSASQPKLQVPLKENQQQIILNPWNPREFMTIGSQRVYMMNVQEEWKSISAHVPEMSMEEFDLKDTTFKSGVFLPIAGHSCVGTSHGDVILLADRSLSDLGQRLPPGERCAVKILRIHNGAINTIMVHKNIILTGGQDGVLKLFDLQFRILFWFDQYHSGGITHILPNPFGELLYAEGISEVIVSTEHNQAFLLSRHENSSLPFRPVTASSSAANSNGTPSISHAADDDHKAVSPLCHTILEGIYGRITRIDVNPIQPKLAIATAKGQLQLWDLQQKALLQTRRFFQKQVSGKKEISFPLGISCMEFSKTGKTIGVGFDSGLVKFIDANSLGDIQSNNNLTKVMENQASDVAITRISFSQDGLWCACSDAENVTILFRKDTIKQKPPSASLDENEIRKPRSRIEWVFIGRRKTHYKDIVAILFHQTQSLGSEEAPIQRLIMVSKDRHVSEIDLAECTTENGIRLKYVRRLEQIYQPETAIILPSSKEDFLLTFNTGGKFRLFQSETQVCRNTCLGPSFSYLLHQILILGDKKFICFASENVSKYNLDDRPCKDASRWQSLPLHGHHCPPRQDHAAGTRTFGSHHMCRGHCTSMVHESIHTRSAVCCTRDPFRCILGLAGSFQPLTIV